MELIVFDLDGTLVDSEPLSFDVLTEMFEDLGVSLDTEALHLDYRGWKMGEVIELLAERHGIVVAAGFEELFRVRQLEAINARLQAVEGVPELLASLDLPMAVVTILCTVFIARVAEGRRPRRASSKRVPTTLSASR